MVQLQTIPKTHAVPLVFALVVLHKKDTSITILYVFGFINYQTTLITIITVQIHNNTTSHWWHHLRNDVSRTPIDSFVSSIMNSLLNFMIILNSENDDNHANLDIFR